MNIFSTLRTAYKALRIHKARSALTVLGLVVGVTAIIVVMNLGKSIEGFVLGQIEVFGTDYINTEIKVPSTSKTSSQNSVGIAQGISITTLKEEDAREIIHHPNIRDAYYGLVGQEIASFEGTDKTYMIWGMSASFFDLNNAKVAEGRGYTEEEDRSQVHVTVLGQSAKEDLFGEDQALGKRIKVGNKKFTVVGIMEDQGDAFFMDMNAIIYIPIRTLQKQIMGVDHIQFIISYMHDPMLSEATSADIIEIMRDQHEITNPNKDDFAVTSSEEAMGMLGVITGGISLLLMAIAGISLLVGGVGIMNIMYVSVSERTYEIGLRKAVGATSSHILWQFLWETILLTFSGGLIGVILGTLISFGSSFAIRAFGFDWPFYYSLPGLIIAIIFSVFIGLVFGIYPAKKAANMQPVEALSYE